MKSKMTCVAILLAFGFLVAVASADQSCRFTLTAASKIHNAELRPGDYKLVVDGPKVVLTDLNSGKKVEIEAKIESVGTKFAATEVHSKEVGGARQISEIRMGGSNTRIAFD